MSLALTGSNRRTMRRISAGFDAFEGVRRAEVESVALVGSDLRLPAGGGGADSVAADEAAARLLAAVADPDALALAATGAAAASVVVAVALVVGAWAAVAASDATGSRGRSLLITLTYCWSAL